MEIIFSEEQATNGSLGVITLNRPAALNALNHTMILNLIEKLTFWQTASHIKAVVIKAEGKAFCAGGDLRAAYQGMKEHNPRVLEFFRDEYKLNDLIYHYQKPYIAFLNGITMGGGAGISLHGSHSIATEKLMFAMPETALGFFPDVGGTYFLSRLPGKVGIYLGLTGARINRDDAYMLGIVTHAIESESLSQIMQALKDTSFENDAKKTVTDILQHFQIKPIQSNVFSQQAIINKCFSEHTIELILQTLKNNPDSFCQDTYNILLKKSPMSLKVSLNALLSGKTLDFSTCMQQELNLAKHFLQDNNFVEGIRALLIDKDQEPKWQPKTLAEINEESVQKYFI